MSRQWSEHPVLQLSDGCVSGLCVEYNFAISQHRDTVNPRKDFLKVVGDEKDRGALACAFMHLVFEYFRLNLRKSHRWLIEHEYRRVSRQGLDDLNNLELISGQCASPTPRRDTCPKIVEHLSTRPVHLGDVDEAIRIAASPLKAKKDILRDS